MNNVGRFRTAIPELYASKDKVVDILPEEVFDPKDDEDDDPKINNEPAPPGELITDETEEEIDDFTCAISRETIDTPGMLSCGHFFELGQIDAFRQFQIQRNLVLACPKGCKNVGNNIIQSKQLKNGIEESSKKIAALRKENLELKLSKSEIELEFSKFRSDLPTIIEDKFELMFSLKVREWSERSEKVSKYSKKISNISSEICEQNTLLKEKDRIRKKQIENATPKNLMGRVSFCLWPDSALNKGITPEEQETLASEGLSDQEREYLKKKLNDLKSKMEKIELDVEYSKKENT